ncbi:hypothetical protein MA16_Dca001337 [Dendrobium catenatum]|uniref:Uncharacterized protein n=1 Tax=Dendrobium catenatum TaxID=906689 RepID=A0A2I0WM52_9ASPA|nr:hypothetical protein MA16_Dca001337 [Dendrobium catenatum]
MVLFSGIAAEALICGEAEGGENDENLFRGICLLFQPPLNVPQMANQARWSVMQSYNLLKWLLKLCDLAIALVWSSGGYKKPCLLVVDKEAQWVLSWNHSALVIAVSSYHEHPVRR